jgi:hypothetical protein
MSEIGKIQRGSVNIYISTFSNNFVFLNQISCNTDTIPLH